MSNSEPGRFRAPIRYTDVRRSYNTFRALGGALIALFAAIGWTGDVAPAPLALIAGAFVAVDGAYRLSRGTSALPLLVVDVTVGGVLILASGHSPVIEGPAFIYILTASMLLLPLRLAVWVVVYALSWAIPIVWLTETTTPTGAFELAAVSVFVVLIAQLLFSAGRALHSASERHAVALSSERRAVQLKDEFVSMVSHELRTPLTSIAGFTDTLRETWRDIDPGEVEEFLQIMRRETRHLATLVEDILVIPRLEAGRLRLEMTDLDLRTESFEAAEVVYRDGTKEFAVAIPGGVTVFADPVRVKQIFRNLLENARKYGGDQVLIEGEPVGDLYQVVISDNGPGVSETDQERIFEHFEQATKGDARSEQGVGLGLPIARKLARAMGGDLWYESRFPTGARFCFTVQLARAAHGSEAEAGGLPISRTA